MTKCFSAFLALVVLLGISAIAADPMALINATLTETNCMPLSASPAILMEACPIAAQKLVRLSRGFHDPYRIRALLAAVSAYRNAIQQNEDATPAANDLRMACGLIGLVLMDPHTNSDQHDIAKYEAREWCQ